MDIGELKNPFSSDKSKAKKTQTGTSGIFKIGDYDEKPKSTKQESSPQDNNPSLTETIKEKMTKN
jgi:hypothetical protein